MCERREKSDKNIHYKTKRILDETMNNLKAKYKEEEVSKLTARKGEITITSVSPTEYMSAMS